jgi:hypothetical protein
VRPVRPYWSTTRFIAEREALRVLPDLTSAI